MLLHILSTFEIYLLPLNQVFKNQLLESHGCFYLQLWSLAVITERRNSLDKRAGFNYCPLSVIIFLNSSFFVWPGFFCKCELMEWSLFWAHRSIAEEIISVRDFWICYFRLDDLFESHRAFSYLSKNELRRRYSVKTWVFGKKKDCVNGFSVTTV